MNISVNKHEIILIDEPLYSCNSTDNQRSYGQILCRNSAHDHYSAHGLAVGDLESPEASVILLGSGGATGVHLHSSAYKDNLCFVAAGDAVFALELPTLELKWCEQVDSATCFGVYWLETEDCLITWGEIQICRYTLDGEKVWSVSGADIFEGFECKEKYIELTDIDSRQYAVNIKTGKIQNQG